MKWNEGSFSIPEWKSFLYPTFLYFPSDQNYGNYGGVENYGWRFFLYLCEFLRKTKLIMFSVSLIVATWNIDRYKILVKGTFPEILKKIWRHDVTWRHFLDFWFPRKPPVTSRLMTSSKMNILFLIIFYVKVYKISFHLLVQPSLHVGNLEC